LISWREELEVQAGESSHWSSDSDRLYFIIVRRGLQEVATIDVYRGNVDILGHRHILKLAVTSELLVFAAASPDRPAEVFACNHDGGGAR
jgi:hypothetical protein